MKTPTRRLPRVEIQMEQVEVKPIQRGIPAARFPIISSYNFNFVHGPFRGKGKPHLVYMTKGAVVLAAAEYDRPADMATFAAVTQELSNAEAVRS